MATLKKDKDIKKNLLEVDSLSINYGSGKRLTRAVKNISFSVEQGTTTSIVGESGSGKSTTAAAIIGLLPHASGTAKMKGYAIPSHPKFIKAGFNRFLSEQMQFVFQDPFTSLNPRTRVGNVLNEPLKVNNPIIKEEADAFIEFTHQINNLIVDTMWTSDVKKDDLKLMINRITNERKELVHDAKAKIDLAVYRIKNINGQIWQTKRTEVTKIATFRELRIAEQTELLNKNASDHELREKIHEDNIKLNEFTMKTKEERRKAVKSLKDEIQKHKKDNREARKARRNAIKRLDADKEEFDKLVSKFSPVSPGSSRWKIRRGDHLSEEYLHYLRRVGSNKANLLVRMMSYVKEQRLGAWLDWINFSRIVKDINPIVFSSRKATVEAEVIVNEFFKKYSKLAIRRRTVQLIQDRLVEVGLRKADINRYAREFSGGQRQRIAIARAMMTNPSLMIADEPISSLDVSIQAQVINIFKDIQEAHGLTILFIAHDLRMVEHISDYIAVMSKGQIVEYGKTTEVFENPTHPYTRSLLSAIPSIDTINLRLNVVEYDYKIYQNEDLELKEFFVSPTHKVLGREDWIKNWKKDAKDFIVYENQVRHVGDF